MKKKTILTVATLATLTLGTPLYTPIKAPSSIVYASSKDKKDALDFAEMVNDTPLSKKDFYATMKEGGYNKKTTDYVVKKLKVSWKKNALKSAENMYQFTDSKEKIKKELISKSDGGNYTQKEAEYAIKHLKDKPAD